jgi:hypothetical protein
MTIVTAAPIRMPKWWTLAKNWKVLILINMDDYCLCDFSDVLIS